MAENAIEIRSLRFGFGRNPILDGLSLEVPKGTIFGFLGQNGAGKTTTLRLLTGLLAAPNETLFIDGKELNNNRTELMSVMGSLIGTPSAYPKMTAHQHMKYWCKLYRIDKTRADELLAKVSLWKDRNKKLKNFSTGMIQRLNIAYILLRNPRIILLDEPFNGLDPEGVFLLKNILTQWHSEEKTILCSSHILSEMEQFCSHIAFIDGGKIRYQGSLDNLLKDKENQKRELVVVVDQVERATQLLSEASFEVRVENNTCFIPFISAQELTAILQLFITHSILIESVNEQKNSLEARYINLLNSTKE